MWRLAFLVAACSQPSYVSGHLHCAATGRMCPDDFYCGADNLCWRNGSGPEMGVMLPDMAVGLEPPPVDLAGADFAGADLSVLPDLSVLFDLAGVDAAPPSLCPGTFKICDSFETATFNARWNPDSHNGSITIDKSRAYRGTQSLHLHTNAAAGSTDPYANLIDYSMLPLTGMAFARAWFYIPATYQMAFNQLLNFSDSAGQGVSFASESDKPILNDYSTPSTFNQSNTVTLPRNQWVCLSLQVGQGTATGTVKLFVNDVEVADTTVTNATTPTMTHIYLGLDWVNNPSSFPATDLWMDEVIIHNAPVSCSD